MQKIKYITYIEPIYNIETGIMFPSIIEHSKMHECLGSPKLIGAGFVSIIEDKKRSKHGEVYVKLSTYGKSTSLDLTSNVADACILMIGYMGNDYRVH